MLHDPKWERTNWFDGLKTYDYLRIMQMESGPRQVETYEALFIGLRHLLLKYVSLMFMVAGAGKTLQIVATLLAINRVVNDHASNGPRCANVLWFVNETQLATQLMLELQDEVTRFHLHTSAPTVQVCSRSGDLERGPNGCAITISCPHALWKRSNQSRTDEKIAEILSQFDTIIWDECDFAADQISRLVRLAPHALKFGLTATPIDADGVFLRTHFVLAGVATYQQVYDNDRCLKKIIPWAESVGAGYVQPVSYGSHSRYWAGSETDTVLGKHGQKSSLPGAMATLRKAIDDASALEGGMRRDWPEHWFSPHIFVVSSSVGEAEHLHEQINDDLRLRAQQEPLIGEGWRATVMYDGYKADDPSEQHVFHKNPKLTHPFMRAKQNRGRCDENSARIHIVVDMGLRGLNDWPLLFIVDVSRGNSVNVQVQLKGRDHRLPSHLAPLVDSELFERYCTGRYYFPDSGGSSGAMEKAYSFILNDIEMIESADFNTWGDLVSGKALEGAQDPQGTEAPFTFVDRLQVDEALGKLVQEGAPIDGEAIEALVSQLPPVMTEKRKKRVVKHIERALNDKLYRARLMDTTIPAAAVIQPVAREEPKEVGDYSVAELAEYVLSRPEYGAVAAAIAESLSINPQMKFVMAVAKRAYDARHYRPVNKIYQLQRANERPGILTTLADRMTSDLLRLQMIKSWSEGGGQVRAAVNEATARLCGMPPTADGESRTDGALKNGSVLDKPAYHHEFCRPQTAQRIKDVAVALLVHWGRLPNLAALYMRGQNDDALSA